MFPSEKINQKKLKIYSFLIETGRRSSSACGNWNSINLDSHFLINTRIQSDRERDMLSDEVK